MPLWRQGVIHMRRLSDLFTAVMAASVLAASAAGAGEEMEEAVSYTISYAEVKPELKGKWDGEAWQQAEPVDIAIFHERSTDHRPGVQAKLLYDEGGIYAIFCVDDRYVKCVFTEYGDPVCRDSCVEFFVQPKEDLGYFNFEFSAIGTLFLQYNVPQEPMPGAIERHDVPKEAAETIRVYHTLNGPITEEIEEPTTWILEYYAPFELMEEFVGELNPQPGDVWRGNLYKCADSTSKPHWASWGPMAEKLSFHRPDYFWPLVFGDKPKDE
jgi:hypothetical protein